VTSSPGMDPDSTRPGRVRAYRLVTTHRVTTVLATSTDQARAIFTAGAWPVQVPPAPRPAELADGHPTDAWLVWWRQWRPVLWHRLDNRAGERLLRVEEAERDTVRPATTVSVGAAR